MSSTVTSGVSKPLVVGWVSFAASLAVAATTATLIFYAHLPVLETATIGGSLAGGLFAVALVAFACRSAKIQREHNQNKSDESFLEESSPSGASTSSSSSKRQGKLPPPHTGRQGRSSSLPGPGSSKDGRPTVRFVRAEDLPQSSKPLGDGFTDNTPIVDLSVKRRSTLKAPEGKDKEKGTRD